MYNRIRYFLIIVTLMSFNSLAEEVKPAQTGVSGVYEVMIGTDDAKPLITFLGEFGFSVKEQARFSDSQAFKLYGVKSELTSFRLQNGDIDSHGLIRILQWKKPTGDGVGYSQPETVGQRMMVMRTKDIVRIHDVFSDARLSGEKWLPTEPIYADLYGLTEGKPNVLNRRIGVREMGIYGELVNLVFFQRYGYTIPGYGTIGDHSPLQTSEITHNDFMLGGKTKEDLYNKTNYYRDVLGFKPEGPVVLDGDWQAGPKRVFNMADGSSHWYRGFVSPNDISGKLKFFINPDIRPDRSDSQAIGQKGITLHSVYTKTPNKIYKLAQKHKLNVSKMYNNEFGEASFVIKGPDGASWQVIERKKVVNAPVLKLDLVKTNQ
ncbi:hypothetical protein [Pseudocolwellia agarivorans]|uniref:hypothetical protein n=1 Tax=Pseudocolwellia agarivorans TaxID=1911682 RepID=UPI001C379198|nr:hypothetical protein [Pseudocolwellia agarivorans]